MHSIFTVAVLGGLALTACTETQLPEPGESPETPTTEVGEPGVGAVPRPTTPPPAAPNCATATVASWTGTASRHAENYPDDVEATVRWELVSRSGCVDRYQPRGEARYVYAIPGALCEQTIAPAASSVSGGHGTLAVNRSTSPATYTATASSTWNVTWTCTFDNGSRETMTFEAGGRWLEASGTVDGGLIEGTRVEDDGSRCGRGESALPCTYGWTFAPAGA